MEQVVNILNWAKNLIIANPIPSLIVVVFVVFLLVIMLDY